MTLALLATAIGLLLILAMLALARRHRPERRKRGRGFTRDSLPIYFGGDGTCSNGAAGATHGR